MIIIPFACTPTAERPIDDSFFVPIDTLARKNVKSGPLQPAQIDSQAIIADENIKKSIAGTILDQDRRLDNVIRQLDMVSKEVPMDTMLQRKNIRYTADVVIDKKVSNEVLLEMIKQTNQKLEDVIERLRVFTYNQQKKRNRIDSNIVRVDKEPVQPQIALNEANSGYAEAIQLYRQKQYKSAIRAFQMLLKEKIDITLQDNCHFWIGVCFFNLKKANSAIGEFLTVLDIPGSDKKEGAYFMIGQCHEQLGTKSYARTMFRKVIREYPQGDLKQVAEIKLALLR
jgi:TolA-binding protein